jgi:hypothetical protein
MAAGREVVLRRLPLLLAPLAFAACGGGATTSVSGDPIYSAVDKTLAQGSEKVALDAKVDVSGQSFSVTGTGAFSRTAGELHLQLTVPLLGASTLDELVKGHVAWISSPLLAGSLHGKHWLRLELGRPANVLGFDLSALLIGQSPSGLLRTLQHGAVAADVNRLGTETVGGVSTTHYRVAVGEANTKALVPTEDAWVDGEHLVRKVSHDFTAPVSATGGKTALAHTVLTMTFSDFGTPVTVAPPPATDTVSTDTVGK